ncbi:MAG: single-stranded DNA-binding protein [Chthonomonadales bacterium]
MLNRIVLIGRLTRDPEASYTPSGISIAKFRLAVDRGTKKADTGEKETDFLDVVAFRKTADFVNSYVTKGRLVYVEGRLQSRSWTAQDGNRRIAYEIVADNVGTLDRRPDAAPGDVTEKPIAPAHGVPADEDFYEPDEEGDPFRDE